MIPEHSRHVERLKRDRTEAVYEFSAELVLVVLALVGNPLVLDCDMQPRPVSTVAAFALTAQTPLSNHQSPFAALQTYGPGYRSPHSAECKEADAHCHSI